MTQLSFQLALSGASAVVNFGYWEKLPNEMIRQI